MKKSITISLATLMVIIFLNSKLGVAVSPYVGVEVGDIFEYDIISTHVVSEYNGVSYTTALDIPFEGENMTLEVKQIVDNAGKTYIKSTNTINEEVYQTETRLDQWLEIFASIHSSYLYWLAWDQSLLDGNITEYDNNAEMKLFFASLPMFASTNASLYEEIMDVGLEGVASKFAPRMEDNNNCIKSNEMLVSYSEKNGIFTVNHTNVDTFTGELEGEDWEFTGFYNYDLYIHTETGIVEELIYKYGFTLDVGTNSTTTEFGHGFKNRTINTVKVEVPLLSILLPLIGSTAILTIYKKKK